MQYDDLAEVSSTKLMQANGWQEQYRIIIDWGTRLITLKPDLRQATHLIKGCETSAWLVHCIEQGCHRFAFDSDSRVINGLAGLLLSMMDKKMTNELMQLNFNTILRDAGLEKHLSPSRSNGLKAIIKRAYELAQCESIMN